MKNQIYRIMKNDWYKTATKEGMRVALMHLEQEAMDSLFNQLAERKKEVVKNSFEECSKDCDWD